MLLALTCSMDTRGMMNDTYWMYEGRKSDTLPARLLRDFLAHLLIFPTKKQQRLPVAHDHVFDLCNEDRVIACLLLRMQPAFQVCQCAIEHRSAVLSPSKARSGFFFRTLVRPDGPRIIFRNCPLVFTQHIDAKALLGVQVGMRTCGVVHTNQHQQR